MYQTDEDTRACFYRQTDIYIYIYIFGNKIDYIYQIKIFI